MSEQKKYRWVVGKVEKRFFCHLLSVCKKIFLQLYSYVHLYKYQVPMAQKKKTAWRVF